ncbi:hypothetical protein JXJ21_19145, partial [candidate division KSB1 bacterium]|nr:hypothetical protein [candidate division KSB1 bacterium]
MELITVSTERERKEFIRFPYHHYRNESRWIAPIRSEQRKLFSPAHNPTLRKCAHQMFLLKKNNDVIGRLFAVI